MHHGSVVDHAHGSGEGPTRNLLPEGVLADITHLLVSEGSPERVLEAVADALAELVPHDSLVIYRAEPLLHVIYPVLVRDPQYSDEITTMGPHRYGVGITGITAETGTPQLVNDLHKDVRAIQIAGTPEDEPESMVSVPLLARDELKGVLSVYRTGEGNHFTLAEFKLTILFSELAALAIDNAEIRNRLEAEVVTDHLTALFNHRFFHERLGEEMRRANRQRTRVGLLIYDIDDFKRVNDTYGHLVGDQVLQVVATVSRETCRQEDVICRIGGEEFAVILPGASLEDSVALAERIREGIEQVVAPSVGRVTVSVGVAEGPFHASSPRELIACADLALLAAKAEGKNRTHVYGDGDGELPPPTTVGSLIGSPSDPVAGNGHHQVAGRLASLLTRGEPRSAAQLRVLQNLSAKLNQLNDVHRIGDAIAAELRSLLDYHACRIFLLSSDGETMIPVAVRGAPAPSGSEAQRSMVVKVGEGLTGHVAATRATWYAPDSNTDPYAITIPGTQDVDESLLGVPLLRADRLIGVVVLSKLGIDQFDEEDVRLLEALAAGAAVAFENARLLQAEHEAAEVSAAMLALSRALTQVRDITGVLRAAVDAVPAMLRTGTVAAFVRQDDGSFRLMQHRGFLPDEVHRAEGMVIDAATVERFLRSIEGPFVLTRDVIASVPPEYLITSRLHDTLIAPMRWEPHGLGALAITAPTMEGTFGESDLELARGIADVTSLALGNAGRFDELERAYVSTIEALANALEAQDHYTGDHARALAEMSLAVGGELGLEGERLKLLELTALFHDIGKIGVRSEVIRKPGPLTPAERREMNRHPEIGEQILAPVPFLQSIRPMIRACHERWDGRGYPDGLAGEAIPLEARIVFVCDAYHAMTTDRPYRAALRTTEAIRRLKLSSGTQFDPAVVEAFVRAHRAGRTDAHTHG
jgi:diguanylate cyclase (GGDEF)-like protein